MVSLQLLQKDRHQIWAFSVEIQLKTLYMKKPYVVKNSASHDTGFTRKNKKTHKNWDQEFYRLIGI